MCYENNPQKKRLQMRTKAIILIVLLTGILYSAEMKTERHDIPYKGEVELDVNIEFGLGRFMLKSMDDGRYLLKSQMSYIIDYLKPFVEYKVLGNRGRLHLYTESYEIKGHSKDFKKYKNSYKEAKNNYWALEFNKNVPTAFDIEIGLGEGKMDFTDLMVNDLNLQCGLSDMLVEFNKDNKEQMRNLKIETGLGKVIVKGLGLSNMERFDVECGLGSTTLVFNGSLPRDVRGKISVGLGSVKIEMPDKFAVEIEAEKSFLSSLNLRGFDQVDDNLYRSGNWKTAKRKIYLIIEIGMGSVDIEWID